MAAEIPNGYYDGISGLKDSALKTKLHEIIENHSKNSYSGLFAESFCYTDVRSDGRGGTCIPTRVVTCATVGAA